MASLSAAAAAVKFVESWEFSIFYNSVIFGQIRLFHRIFGNIKASPLILETFQRNKDRVCFREGKPRAAIVRVFHQDAVIRQRDRVYKI